MLFEIPVGKYGQSLKTPVNMQLCFIMNLYAVLISFSSFFADKLFSVGTVSYNIWSCHRKF